MCFVDGVVGCKCVILYVYTFSIFLEVFLYVYIVICNINLYHGHTKSDTYEHKQNFELHIETKQTTSILGTKVYEEWLFSFHYSRFLLSIVKSRFMIKSVKII